MKIAFPFDFNKKTLALLAALALAVGWFVYAKLAEKPAERPVTRVMPVRAATAHIGDMELTAGGVLATAALSDLVVNE